MAVISHNPSQAALTARREAGFTLIEVLSVLAIMSLLIGMVVLNMPRPAPALKTQMSNLNVQANAFFRDGVVAGDVRAMGFGKSGYAFYRYAEDPNAYLNQTGSDEAADESSDETGGWKEVHSVEWPDAVRMKLLVEGETVKLPDDPEPIFMFEPTGMSDRFVLEIDDAALEYRLESNGDGQLVIKQEGQ